MKKAFLVFIVTACMMVTVALAGPPQVVWDRVYDSGHSDHPQAIAVDAAGNIYITGASSNGTDLDYRTIKYDTDGNLQWSKVYDSGGDDVAYSIAVDIPGNVYITGGYGMIKYDTDGNILWNRIYDDSTRGRSIAVDVLSNVYVTGLSIDDSGTENRYSCCTTKYTTDGNLRWRRVYSSSDTIDITGNNSHVAVDVLGNVYVTDSRYEGHIPDYDYWIIKYNTDGNLIWTRIYEDGAYSAGIAVDANANVYVAGTSCDSGVNYKYCTVKYDTDGNFQWNESYAGDSNNDYNPNDVTVDVSGNVYVTGQPMIYPGRAYCTIKYDTDGNFQWDKVYHSDDTCNIAEGVAVDVSYYVYVTGCSHCEGSSDTCFCNFRTFKYKQDNIPAVVEQPKADNLQLKVLRNTTSNPVLQYMLPPSVNGNLVLYSSDGRVVEKLTLTEPESSVIFDCSLPSGVYFAKLTTELSSTIAKVVLVK